MAQGPSWPSQPGQKEKSFQPEQDSGKVFRGHRCGGRGAGLGVEGTPFSHSWLRVTASVPRNQVTCLSVSTDGSVLLSGSHDETVRLWDTQSKQCVRTVTLKGEAPRERVGAAGGSSRLGRTGRARVCGQRRRTRRGCRGGARLARRDRDPRPPQAP